jgi:hypothetical protein
MADTQGTIYGQKFSRNIMPLAQQKESRLHAWVYKEDVTGVKKFSQDQIGVWTMQQVNGRAPATPENDPLFGRRWGDVYDYHDNRILGREDKLKILSDPASMMTKSASGAIGRQIDDTIIDAALGTAYYGETGSSSIALPSSQQIADGSTPMTIAKIQEIARIFDEGNVEMEDRCLVMNPLAKEDLLGDTKATSTDYMNVRNLVNGNIDTFYGFKIIWSTRLPVVSATVTSCFAFQRYGLMLGEQGGAFVETDRRPDKSYMWQVYYAINHGAVRLEDSRVVQCDIYHASA